MGSTKDKKPALEKSGVYLLLVNCNVLECNKVYAGKTKRPLKIRMKEHLNDIKNNKKEKSGLTEHVIESDHNVCEDNFKLLKEVRQYRKLDIAESMYCIFTCIKINLWTEKMVTFTLVYIKLFNCT